MDKPIKKKVPVIVTSDLARKQYEENLMRLQKHENDIATMGTRMMGMHNQPENMGKETKK